MDFDEFVASNGGRKGFTPKTCTPCTPSSELLPTGAVNIDDYWDDEDLPFVRDHYGMPMHRAHEGWKFYTGD